MVLFITEKGGRGKFITGIEKKKMLSARQNVKYVKVKKVDPVALASLAATWAGTCVSPQTGGGGRGQGELFQRESIARQRRRRPSLLHGTRWGPVEWGKKIGASYFACVKSTSIHETVGL